MSVTMAGVICVAISAVVILFALRKKGFVRAVLSLHRFLSFELEASDRPGVVADPELKQPVRKRSA